VVEGLNLQSGTYTLSFSGTAQGKIGAGSFAASGVTGAAVGGTNLNIEFNTGTLSLVQLEKGSTATSFDYRPYGTELALCQRYCYNASLTAAGDFGVGVCTSSGAQVYVSYPVTMRSAPTVTFATAGNFVIADGVAGYTVTSTGTTNITTNQTTVNMGASGTTTGKGALLRWGAGTAFILSSAEL